MCRAARARRSRTQRPPWSGVRGGGQASWSVGRAGGEGRRCGEGHGERGREKTRRRAGLTWVGDRRVGKPGCRCSDATDTALYAPPRPPRQASGGKRAPASESNAAQGGASKDSLTHPPLLTSSPQADARPFGSHPRSSPCQHPAFVRTAPRRWLPSRGVAPRPSRSGAASAALSTPPWRKKGAGQAGGQTPAVAAAPDPCRAGRCTPAGVPPARGERSRSRVGGCPPPKATHRIARA